MERASCGDRWWSLATELFTGMKEWRHAHTTAPFNDIESALDARLHSLRARMLEDLALASTVATWSEAPPSERPRCRQCDVPLESRGEATRELQTVGGEQVVLSRAYGVCPACDAGLFPPR